MNKNRESFVFLLSFITHYLTLCSNKSKVTELERTTERNRSLRPMCSRVTGRVGASVGLPPPPPVASNWPVQRITVGENRAPESKRLAARRVRALDRSNHRRVQGHNLHTDGTNGKGLAIRALTIIEKLRG
jgi:hypothetical protein